MLIVDRVAGDFNDDGRIGTHGSISAVSSDPRTKRIAFDNYQRIGQDRTQEGITLEVRHRLTVNKKRCRAGRPIVCWTFSNLVTVLTVQRNEQDRRSNFGFFPFPLRS